MKIQVLEVNIDDLNYGGVFMLIKNVLENRGNNLEIDVASIEGFRDVRNIEYFNKLGSKVFYIGGGKNKVFKQLYVYVNLKRLLRTSHYDCVHIHADTGNKLLVSAIAAKHSGIKKIIVHSHASGVEGSHRKVKKLFHALCRRYLHKYANIYVACSDKAAKWMFSDKDNVKIINNGIDLKKFRYNPSVRNVMRQELGITDDELLIGHVGRFAYPKNHDYMIRIIQRLLEMHEKVKMVFVGNGELEEEIKSKTKAAKIEPHVIFYGTSNCVEKILQAMDVFILPSRYEGFCIAGVEAQASGLPVLYSDTLPQSVKITDNVEFISIEDSFLEKWCMDIIKKKDFTRFDTYDVMKSGHFDILDTIADWEKLYF